MEIDQIQHDMLETTRKDYHTYSQVLVNSMQAHRKKKKSAPPIIDSGSLKELQMHAHELAKQVSKK